MSDAEARAEFYKWIDKVAYLITKFSGVGIEDLADQEYWSWWADETPPGKAAIRALESEGFQV